MSSNQLVRVTNPEGITESYTYDYLNQNLSKIKGEVTTDYEYDGLGRVLSISASGNSKDEEILYTYDLMGNIQSMTDSSGITEYFYNSLGQLTREIKGEDIKEYSYDANGNRITFKLNSDIDLSYTYDKLNRLISVNDGTDTTTYTYDNNGNILNQTGKVSVDNSYNKAGFLKSKVNKSNGNILNQYDLSYYLNGNISDISEPNKTTSYTYDNIGRLTKETILNESETDYSYDNFSNRSLKTVKDANGNILSQSTYTYSKNNQLIEEQTGNILKTNYYDGNGNLICKTKNTLVDQADTGDRITISNVKGNDVESYSYDALNRMIKYENGNKTASYTYNGNGLRQSKTVNGIETKHVYDGQNIVKDGENTFVRGIGIISANLNGTKTYYSFNTHNDTEKLLNAQGVVLKDYTYDAFGNEQTPNDEDTNPFRYCGEYFDNETGFIYLRARYYDPSIGRFTTEDTHWNINNMIFGDKEYKEDEIKIPDLNAIKQSSNLYVYCMDNPMKFIDPNGDTVVTVSVISSAGIGVGLEAQMEVIVDDEFDWSVVNSVNLNCSVGVSVSIAVTVFPTIDTVEEYVNADTVSFGISINGNGGAVVGAILEDGTEHTGISFSVGIGTDISIDGALTLATHVIKENKHK